MKLVFPKEKDQKILMMFISTFTIEEIHQMYMKFYQKYDYDESLTFEINEIKECIDH